MESLNFFRINKDGHVIGIYIDDPANLGIGILPKQICTLKYLKDLLLANCELSRIPEEIGLLASLRLLDLQHNKIDIIPEHISNIKKIKIIK